MEKKYYQFSGSTTTGMMWAVDFGNGSTVHPMEREVKYKAATFIQETYGVELDVRHIIIQNTEVKNERGMEELLREAFQLGQQWVQDMNNDKEPTNFKKWYASLEVQKQVFIMTQEQRTEIYKKESGFNYLENGDSWSFDDGVWHFDGDRWYFPN